MLRSGSVRNHLVIDVGDIHDEVNVVAKVIGHNPTQNILGDIVPIKSQGKLHDRDEPSI